VEELKVNLLLSNAALHERKARVDFDSCTLSLPDVGGGFKAPFLIFQAPSVSKPVVRKVTLRDMIVLQPKEKVYARVNFAGLPPDRTYVMVSEHPAVSTIAVDWETPRIATLTNPTDKELKIAENARLGTIRECTDAVLIGDAFAALIEAEFNTDNAASSPALQADKLQTDGSLQVADAQEVLTETSPYLPTPNNDERDPFGRYDTHNPFARPP